MPLLRRLKWMVAIILVVFPGIPFFLFLHNGEPGLDYHHIVPLFGTYFVQAEDWNDPDGRKWGRYQIVNCDRLSELDWDPYPPPDFNAPGPFRDPRFVSDVTKFAVRDHNIIGQTTSQYFILNGDSSTVEFYDRSADYSTALTKSGLSDLKLIDPDELASKLPAETIRPWAYRNMKSRWGHSDIWWVSLIELLFILAIYYVGLVLPRGLPGRARWARRMGLCGFAVIVALCMDIVVHDQIIPDPVAQFAGAIIYPPAFLVVALLGRGAKRLITKLFSSSSDPAKSLVYPASS